MDLKDYKWLWKELRPASIAALPLVCWCDVTPELPEARGG